MIISSPSIFLSSVLFSILSPSFLPLTDFLSVCPSRSWDETLNVKSLPISIGSTFKYDQVRTEQNDTMLLRVGMVFMLHQHHLLIRRVAFLLDSSSNQTLVLIQCINWIHAPVSLVSTQQFPFLLKTNFMTTLPSKNPTFTTSLNQTSRILRFTLSVGS